MRMTRSWFYRLLLSYLPVFLFIVTMLLLVSFFILSDLSRKSAVKANDVFIQRVLQTIDNSLQDIENIMLREIFSESEIHAFINPLTSSSASAYDVGVKLMRIRDDNPAIDSLYVVRMSDGVVVTESTITRLSQFHDTPLLDLLKKTNSPYYWSGIREYTGFQNKKTNVISLAKEIHLSSGGFLIINVSASYMEQLLREMSDPGINDVMLLDQFHNQIASVGSLAAEPREQDGLSQLVSGYTGYEIRSGFRFIALLDKVSTFTYICILIGFLSICTGIAWIVFVSRWNYKPMERIIERIHTLKSRKNDIPAVRQDEFKMIEAAIDKMAEESSFYEKQVEENKVYRRQVQLQDLLEGRHPTAGHMWLSERSKSENEIGANHQHVVAVVEIDRYPIFSRSFPAPDQNLLKYNLEKTISEITSSHSVALWTEWVAGNRLAIIVELPKTDHSDSLPRRICTEVRVWVQDNLPFTVTFGLGDIVDGLQFVSSSYKTALLCLDYKPSIGNNQVITASDTEIKPQADMFSHVQLVRPFASAYKRGEEQWKNDCTHFFAELRKGAFTRDDLISMMNYMVYYFHREMMEHTVEFRTLWETEAMPGLTSMLDEDETLMEIEQRFTRILTDLYHHIGLIRERRNNHIVLKQVRDYIEEHYGDTGMSLTYLSDQFGINGKYLSRLYKEEFGENFGEHLMQIRMEHAKKMLLDSASSIQDIAEKVGYTTSIAFIRVFKKVVGTTPGDYRKQRIS
ncbi:MAG: hypothetical protein K0Q81_1699 [Paenibacillus sp.]|nr:hypothetical protein [Paenibacillus sp.]